MNKNTEEIAESLRTIGHAHHRAFIMVNGADPDWARWYAAKLEPELNGKLAVSLSVEELAGLLPLLEKERTLRSPQSDWAQFYAEAIVKSFG
ncbi:MAG: hypothetical protein P3T54_06935 [Dehalogenimonas sp.]|uniref:Uncharacterized protein n=1 Tax=Candidatus Dehalogenimonas loeffleri TaxID=3127115 RepID=A0ABZ2J420_9CHLR|nr:hypothetical protein [Dehalogenimonas sp.]